MSKVKLLLGVISDIRSLADSLQAVADAINENEPTTTLSQDTPAKEEKQTKKKQATKKEVTMEEVRGKLAEISQSGRTAEVRELIKKYGGTKLSDIEAKDYADILKEAEVIANAR